MPAACELGHDLRVLAVDDDPGVLSALQRLLRGAGLGVLTARSGGEALALLAEHSASIGAVVTDYAMPGINGVDLLRAVRQQWPDIARVLLTGQADVSVAARAVNEGQPVHFFTKPWRAAEVRSALVEVIRQHHARLHERDASCSDLPVAPLTRRERQVLGLLAEGLTNRQIAANLHVSPATARNHVEHILRKLEATDRTQAAVKAVERGLLAR